MGFDRTIPSECHVYSTTCVYDSAESGMPQSSKIKAKDRSIFAQLASDSIPHLFVYLLCQLLTLCILMVYYVSIALSKGIDRL